MTHGMSGTRTHANWITMKQRCANPKNPDWSNYGARGIRVCKRWLDFANFYADMGKRPAGKSLDRIDNDGNYEPGNCRWATPKQQVLNRRAYGRTSKLRGVYWCKRTEKWQAQITRNGVNRYLGRFTSEHEAAKAYVRASRGAER